MLNIKHYKQRLTRRMILADRNARGQQYILQGKIIKESY